MAQDLKEPKIFAVVDSSLTLIDWTKTRAMADAIANNQKNKDEYSIMQFGWNGWCFVLMNTTEPKKGVKNVQNGDNR